MSVHDYDARLVCSGCATVIATGPRCKNMLNAVFRLGVIVEREELLAHHVVDCRSRPRPTFLCEILIDENVQSAETVSP